MLLLFKEKLYKVFIQSPVSQGTMKKIYFPRATYEPQLTAAWFETYVVRMKEKQNLYDIFLSQISLLHFLIPGTQLHRNCDKTANVFLRPAPQINANTTTYRQWPRTDTSIQNTFPFINQLFLQESENIHVIFILSLLSTTVLLCYKKIRNWHDWASQTKHSLLKSTMRLFISTVPKIASACNNEINMWLCIHLS